MKFCPWLRGGLLFLSWILPVAAVERLPIADFAREAEASNAQLSPDGKRLAFLRNFDGQRAVHVMDLATGKLSYIDVGRAELMEDAPKEVASFTWVGNERLLLMTTVWDTIFGMLAVNWDGSQPAAVSGYETVRAAEIIVKGPTMFSTQVVHRLLDEDDSVLMLDRHETGGGSSRHPDVLLVRTTSGLARTVVKNPGEVVHWGIDFKGVARFGILVHGDLSGAIYRERENTEWKTILPLKNRDGEMRVAGFDAGGNQILVTMLNAQKRRAVFPLNPASGEVGAPLLSDPEYDVVPDDGMKGVAGIELAQAIFSRRKQALAGIRFYTESPRVKWFDPEYASVQAAVDKSLPNTVNLLVNESVDGKRMLWLGFSDQNPGVYYLFDREKRSFKAVAPRGSWLKPAQMAQMLSVKYKARDALTIHGYLTVPAGHELKNLPMVVMPHGGPWVRDTWGFDPLVQLLANRGYAVLQMNFRGSTGYGDELFEKAKRQIGKQVQDDIEDGTRWAIAAGVADPKRIAIGGASYGGYSALFALGHNPELYRCGISMAGVTDWPRIYDDSDAADYKEAKRHWREQIGDPGKDLATLRAISPVNFAEKIVAPVLIVQGKQDKRVPPDQARRMISALERVGRKPESLFLSDLGHSMGNEKQRTEIYTAVAAFLEKNLGPGVN